MATDEDTFRCVIQMEPYEFNGWDASPFKSNIEFVAGFCTAAVSPGASSGKS